MPGPTRPPVSVPNREPTPREDVSPGTVPPDQAALHRCSLAALIVLPPSGETTLPRAVTPRSITGTPDPPHDGRERSPRGPRGAVVTAAGPRGGTCMPTAQVHAQPDLAEDVAITGEHQGHVARRVHGRSAFPPWHAGAAPTATPTAPTPTPKPTVAPTTPAPPTRCGASCRRADQREQTSLITRRVRDQREQVSGARGRPTAPIASPAHLYEYHRLRRQDRVLAVRRDSLYAASGLFGGTKHWLSTQGMTSRPGRRHRLVQFMPLSRSSDREGDRGIGHKTIARRKAAPCQSWIRAYPSPSPSTIHPEPTGSSQLGYRAAFSPDADCAHRPAGARRAHRWTKPGGELVHERSASPMIYAPHRSGAPTSRTRWFATPGYAILWVALVHDQPIVPAINWAAVVPFCSTPARHRARLTAVDLPLPLRHLRLRHV